MSSETIEIFFVEDNPVIRFALKSLLARLDRFKLVGNAGDGRSAVDQVRELRPAVVLVDIGLPDIDGIEVTKQIKSTNPETRVLMLTASEDEGDIFDALDAGADGYVLKGAYSRNLESAIRSVRLGAVWLDPAIARSVLRAAQRPASKRSTPSEAPLALSNQERDVLGQVADSDCKDGVCLVDPSFLRNLRRFSSGASSKSANNPARSQC